MILGFKIGFLEVSWVDISDVVFDLVFSSTNYTNY